MNFSCLENTLNPCNYIIHVLIQKKIVTSTDMSVAKWFTENSGSVMFMGTCGML
jgi:hypothetical protein